MKSDENHHIPNNGDEIGEMRSHQEEPTSTQQRRPKTIRNGPLHGRKNIREYEDKDVEFPSSFASTPYVRPPP